MTQQELLKLEDGKYELTDGENEYLLKKETHSDNITNYSLIHKSMLFFISINNGKVNSACNMAGLFLYQYGLPTHFEDIKLK